MDNLESQTAINSHNHAISNRTLRLKKFSRQWDNDVRHELRQLAQSLWPGFRLFNFFPIQSFRLRKRREMGVIIWWIEHDIPPYDRYQCEAYRVEISPGETGQPRLVVRSGLNTYPVVPMSRGGLRSAVVRAGSDKPLIISRKFGSALDP